jgi:nucleoside-diphosphate-sugar epimerase
MVYNLSDDGVRQGTALRRMIALVTGAAGFIGSHLCEHLLLAGDQVRGVDAFTDYYPRGRKEENVSALRGRDGFDFVEGDLAAIPLAPLVDGVDIVYHVAAQPGVRSSWGSDFALYVERNVLATQRLLEECRGHPLSKLVYTSSSSVYGDAASYPTPESACPHPVSPYGVTKLAGEYLCEQYRATYSVPAVSLRLFTVYGPRQRPDMAFTRLIACAIRGDVFELYGDGSQTRDATFVGDVVTALRDAGTTEWAGTANVGGGMRVSMNEVVEQVSSLCGPVEVTRQARAAGDVVHTGADIRVAAAAFGYHPRTPIDEGLRATVDWERRRLEAMPA